MDISIIKDLFVYIFIGMIFCVILDIANRYSDNKKNVPEKERATYSEDTVMYIFIALAWPIFAFLLFLIFLVSLFSAIIHTISHLIYPDK